MSFKGFVMEWVKPSGKCGESSHCLEVGAVMGMVFLQNSSTDPILAREGIVSATRAEFAAFVKAAKLGEYDDFCTTNIA